MKRKVIYLVASGPDPVRGFADPRKAVDLWMKLTLEGTNDIAFHTRVRTKAGLWLESTMLDILCDASNTMMYRYRPTVTPLVLEDE